MNHRRILPATLFGVACSISSALAFDCNISAYGTLATGEVFSGSASDVAGIVDGEWTHDGDGIHVQSDGSAVHVTCRLNGGLVAEVSGAAIVNGVPGFQYFVQVVDNRGPPTGSSIVLEASRERHGRPSAAMETFAEPTTVRIPGEIAVTVGEAGGGRVMLKLGETVCWYRGNGEESGCGGDAFVFDRCVGGGGLAPLPGDLLDVEQARLHITGAGLHCPGGTELVAVRADIGTGLVPVPGVPDLYTILVGDAGGTVIYSFSANIENGDLAVERLP